MKTLKNIATALKVKSQKLAAALTTWRQRAHAVLANNDGNFVMEHAVVAVIIIAVAAIVIGALIIFIQNDMMPTVKTKILDLFNT